MVHLNIDAPLHYVSGMPRFGWLHWLHNVVPVLWITKEIMSRGPQVVDMECQETT
jgi:hypothetical protein